VIARPVSSNFDPRKYHRDGTIQLYYEDKFATFTGYSGIRMLNIKADKHQINDFRGYFLGSGFHKTIHQA